MSINASFGPEEEEIIGEDKANISFENLANKNLGEDNGNGSPNNNIFNSVPMEIESQENEKINFYQNILVKENINYHLSMVFNILKNLLKSYKLKFLYELKQKSNNKYAKLVKAEIIFMNIQQNLQIFNYIFNRDRKEKLNNCFIKLKKHISLLKFLEAQEEKKSNEIKKKIKNANEQLKKCEKNYKEALSGVEGLKNIDEKLNEEINVLEQKNKSLNEKYNELVQKSKVLKESISINKQKSANYSSTMDTKNSEPRILDLQKKIKEREDEKEKNMSYFEDFYHKMNDMLGKYESNYDTIISTMNTTNQNMQ